MYPIFEVNDANIAYPMADQIPPKDKIPKEFWDLDMDNKWYNFISTWFYSGCDGNRLVPKEGVDTTEALRAIKSIIGSFSPSHEHKFAACSFLLSEWFSDIREGKVKQENK